MSNMLICIGVGPIAGCGKILTKKEKKYYEQCCEQCIRKWDDEVDAWRKGGQNDYFDKEWADQLAKAPIRH